MAAVPVNTITARTDRNVLGAYDQVCGTCGCVVAYEHVARHIAWHGAAWGSPVVTANDKTVGP